MILRCRLWEGLGLVLAAAQPPVIFSEFLPLGCILKCNKLIKQSKCIMTSYIVNQHHTLSPWPCLRHYYGVAMMSLWYIMPRQSMPNQSTNHQSVPQSNQSASNPVVVLSITLVITLVISILSIGNSWKGEFWLNPSVHKSCPKSVVDKVMGIVWWWIVKIYP